MLGKSSKNVIRRSTAQVHILIAPSDPGVASPTNFLKKAGLLNQPRAMSENPRPLSKAAWSLVSHFCR